MFYIVCRSIEERTGLMEFLKEKKIGAVFHYLSLHKSPFYQDKHDDRALPYADHYTDCLLRLPLYYELVTPEKMYIIQQVKAYFTQLA